MMARGEGEFLLKLRNMHEAFLFYDSSEGKKITNSFKAIFHIQELMR